MATYHISSQNISELDIISQDLQQSPSPWQFIAQLFCLVALGTFLCLPSVIPLKLTLHVLVFGPSGR